MKQVAIVTIQDINNYGNRLQNYAVQQVLISLGCNAISLKNCITLNTKEKFVFRFLKFIINKDKPRVKNDRLNNFLLFNRNIHFSNSYVTPYSKISNKFDFFIVGSDQVWNPEFGRLRDVDLLTFANNKQKIAFSASIGANRIQDKYKSEIKEKISSFKNISVRETRGKEIIEEITGRNDVEVLIDPTMLLTPEEWDRVSNRPIQFDSIKEKKYILNYFLGEVSVSERKEIERVAKENNCHIINILDENDPFYSCGPSEFLYLEKNAFLICTDSFHSSVFAILYNKPFIIFERNEEKVSSMNSRIDTLISKFNLKNVKYNGKNITKDNLKNNYKEAYKLLEKEKNKSIDFLKKALDIE